MKRYNVQSGIFIHLQVVLVLFLSAITFIVSAQITQPQRYEREQKNSDDYFNVISLEEKGVALFRERDKYKNNNKIWELIFLDTTLQEKHSSELEIKERHKMIGYEVAPDHLFFLFRTGETTKNDFELIKLSFEGQEIARYTVKPDLDFRLTHFVKAGASFVFGGYVNNEPAIIIFDTITNNIKVVPGFFQKDTELVDLRTNQNNTFNTVLMDRSTRDDRKIIFRTFDETGKQLLEDLVPIEENRTLQTGITSTLQREDLVVLGTWSEKNSKQAYGFYSLPINPFAEQKINYTSFGELQHFLDYLNPKRAEKIKANAKEDVSAGRTPNFTSHVTPYRLVEYDKGFLLLAEVYNPVSTANAYNSNPYYNPYYTPYGFNPYWPGSGFYYPGMSRMYRPYMFGSNTRNSDDIKTLETVLVAFDETGKLRWDYSVSLDDMKIPALEQVADFTITNNKVCFIYKKESELNIKTIVLEEEPQDKIEKIKTLEESDVIRSEKEYQGGVRHWFSNSFYVWGYQTIRNATKENRTRDVFYINKIQVN